VACHDVEIGKGLDTVGKDQYRPDTKIEEVPIRLVVFEGKTRDTTLGGCALIPFKLDLNGSLIILKLMDIVGRGLWNPNAIRGVDGRRDLKADSALNGPVH